MKRPTRTLGLLWVVALLGIATAAPAQQPQAQPPVRKELREDKKELREDKKELREDRKEIREDRKAGADPKDIREDKKELREDRKELREDRKELREDQKERQKARRKELREKWGDATKRPEARAEFKVHARRIARLDRARKIADTAGKKVLVTRIDKLLEKERARHQKAMDRLKEKAPGGAK